MSSILSDKLLALVDCNNFFVSCERLFNPQWKNVPVVVLSSNDGCIVSRSEEAKALGIPMGAPLFQWKDFMERNQVVTLSSNFSLYADLSRRVMETLEVFHGTTEIYSIDEAFLELDSIQDPLKYCQDLKEKVLKWTGIPVSIGFAPTKTLAKVATKKAKKLKRAFGFLEAKESEKILDELAIEEIWGIGRRLGLSLRKKGIKTVGELIKQDDNWIRHHFSVMLLQTVWELRGVNCLQFDEMEAPKQSIMTSSSFGKYLTEKKDMEEAVSTFASKGAFKLREEGLLASYLQVFIMTNPHHKTDVFYSNQALITFPEPTDFTPDIIAASKQALEVIFRSKQLYKKAGVLLGGFVSPKGIQQDLFSPPNKALNQKKQALMSIHDEVNKRFGYSIVHFAASGLDGVQKSRSTFRSKNFTTQFKDLLIVKI